MEAADAMLTIAELAIGLAGFSGVVVAFVYRGQLLPSDRYRFIGLFTQALNVVLLAFLPFFFHYAGQVGATIWRSASGVALILWALNTWLIGFRLRPTFSAQEALPKYAEKSLWAIGAVYLLLHLGNVGGWPLAPGPLLYLVSLVLLLFIAAFFFASLVMYRATEE